MSAASENLRNHQEQADIDGCIVKVSRQAVEETLAEYDAMLAALEKFQAHYPHGVNPFLDEAYSMARKAIANAHRA